MSSDEIEKKAFDDLVLRVRVGDDQAAEELVRLYEPLVRRELRIRMTSRRLAKLFDSVDICQSVWSSFFVRVVAGQYDLDSPQHLARLLISMVRNKLASHARRGYSLKRSIDRIDEDPRDMSLLQDAQDSPSVQIAVKELTVKIEQHLTIEERQIAKLRRDGLSWEAIARSLGRTAQACRMQLDRAADRVIEHLGLRD